MWPFNKITLVTEPRVMVIQESAPNRPAMLQIAPDHVFEPDAMPLEICPIFAGRVCYQSFGARAGRKTAADYLGHIKEVKHFSIIEHSSVTFYLDGVSRSLTHELVRHRLASYSQLSQRFVAPDNLTFVIPPAQLGERFSKLKWMWRGFWTMRKYKSHMRKLKDDMPTLEKKKIRESARAVLPNATETKIVVTMNLRALLEFFEKRDSIHADQEIHRVAAKMHDIMREKAPHIFT